MYVEHVIRVLAGVVVLLGVALGFFVNEWCLLIPVFAGANLVQSAFTGICPPIMLLRRLGWLDKNDQVVWGGVKTNGAAAATDSKDTDKLPSPATTTVAAAVA